MYNLKGLPTKEDILSKIEQEDIFYKYLGLYPEVGVGYVNPWRNDLHPDCRFYWNKQTPPMLKFKDFATGWNWDCFNIVQIKYQCNFQEALNIIAKDFNLKDLKVDKKLVSDLEIKARLIKYQSANKSKIQVKIDNWRINDIAYWKEYYIDEETLSLYSVHPITHAWINGRLSYTRSSYDLAFAYYFGNDDWKLYFPLHKSDEIRFIHNNPDRLQGYNQLDITGDFLIDTKSMKDVMAMRRFDINAVAPMTETIMLSNKAYSHLKGRYPIIATLKDRDYAGITMTNKMHKEYGTIKLMFDKDEKKDFSDNLKHFGYQYMIDRIEEVKEWLL